MPSSTHFTKPEVHSVRRGSDPNSGMMNSDLPDVPIASRYSSAHSTVRLSFPDSESLSFISVNETNEKSINKLIPLHTVHAVSAPSIPEASKNPWSTNLVKNEEFGSSITIKARSLTGLSFVKEEKKEDEKEPESQKENKEPKESKEIIAKPKMSKLKMASLSCKYIENLISTVHTCEPFTEAKGDFSFQKWGFCFPKGNIHKQRRKRCLPKGDFCQNCKNAPHFQIFFELQIL